MSETQKSPQQKELKNISRACQPDRKDQIEKIPYFQELREFFEEVDTDVIFVIEKFRTRIGNFFWKTISTLFGYPFLWISIGLYYRFSLNMFHVGLVLIFAGFSSLLIFPIKERYKRRRPYEKHRTLSPLTTQKDFSFPSGHTYYATVNAFSLALCYGGFIFNVFALFIGILTGTSRIYLGVHYFSDVLVALILGILIALIIRLIFPFLMYLHVLIVIF
ncbi:MAG: phosphatase PAP2 family protein [Promethearchaeia archaeon]